MSGNDRATAEKILGGAAVGVDLAPWSALELTGADRVRFLNGLVTCDVKALAPGAGAYGFFTSAQGKVLADCVVLADADTLWVQLAPALLDEMHDHVEKYRIADRVTVTKRQDLIAVRWIGAAAEGAVARLLPEAAVPEADWSHLELARGGAGGRAVRLARLGAPAVALVVPAASADGLLREALDLGAAAAPAEELESLRVGAGIARFGVDFGREHFPQETGAEAEAVSYSKGCYLGQEVVARIHYRGGVNRGLRGLRFAAAAPPALGTGLIADGHAVGRVTSTARCSGDSVGLAVLHKRGWEIGQRLELEGGGTAVVTEPGGSRKTTEPAPGELAPSTAPAAG